MHSHFVRSTTWHAADDFQPKRRSRLQRCKSITRVGAKADLYAIGADRMDDVNKSFSSNMLHYSHPPLGHIGQFGKFTI